MESFFIASNLAITGNIISERFIRWHDALGIMQTSISFRFKYLIASLE
jgi:hypothetical protein